MSILPTRRRLSLLILLASTPAMAGEAATGLDPLGQAQAQGDGDPVPATVLTGLPADWEALEGMRVRIDAPLTVTGTDAVDRFGELALSFDGRQWHPSEIARPGTPEHAALAAHNARQRLLLDDGSSQRDPAQVAWLDGRAAPRVGDTVRGAEGVVERNHGSWRLQMDTAAAI